MKIIQTYKRVLTIVEQGLVQKVAHETQENALLAHGICPSAETLQFTTFK
jgi:hypothetical protein